ncbi:MAG: DsbA family protein, partial [Rhodospirillales bacterium]|nr:DsbA family protein [Rhodospirillales bacterium]
ERMQVPWILPDPFPIAALAPSRVFYWFDDRDPEQAKIFAHAAFRTYFGEGKDISKPEALTGAIEAAGGVAVDVFAAIQEPAVKERLKKETTAAIERGVCGSPFFIVDGEPFWGSDRLWMVKKWIRGDNW